MQRLLLPLCVIGVLIGAGTASGLPGAIEQLKEQFSAVSTFSTDSEPSAIVEHKDTKMPVLGPLFLDVDPTSWYKPYVAAAAKRGIVSGYANADGTSNGLFGPGDTVSVAQVLKMAVRAAGIDETQCVTPTKYPHIAAVDDRYAAYELHWSKAFIGCALMRDVRVLKTLPDVDRPAKRAEMVGIIHDVFGIHAPTLTAMYGDTKGHEYESDVAYATVKKIVSGDLDSKESVSTFRPDAPLNRAEAAKIIILSIEAYDGKADATSEGSTSR